MQGRGLLTKFRLHARVDDAEHIICGFVILFIRRCGLRGPLWAPLAQFRKYLPLQEHIPGQISEPSAPKPCNTEGLTVGPSDTPWLASPPPSQGPHTSPFLAVTKVVGPAARAEAIHSPGRRGTVTGAHPWGSGRAASGSHPGSPAQQSHHCPLPPRPQDKRERQVSREAWCSTNT